MEFNPLKNYSRAHFKFGVEVILDMTPPPPLQVVSPYVHVDWWIEAVLGQLPPGQSPPGNLSPRKLPPVDNYPPPPPTEDNYPPKKYPHVNYPPVDNYPPPPENKYPPNKISAFIKTTLLSGWTSPLTNRGGGG